MKSWTDPTNFLKPSCQNVSGWCLASMSCVCNIWACFWWNDGWAPGGSLPRPGLRHQSAPRQSVLLRGGSGRNNDVPMVLDWILIRGTGNSQRHWCLHQGSILKQQKKPTPHWSDTGCRQQARYLWVMDSLPPRTVTDSAPTQWCCRMLQAAECLQAQLAGLCWAARASFVATIKRFLIGVILLITSSVHLFLSQSSCSWWNRLVMIVGSQKWDRFYSLTSQNLNRLINFDWRFQTGLSTADTILVGLHIHLSDPKLVKDPWRKMPSLPQAGTAAADLLEPGRCAAHAWSGNTEIFQLSSRHWNIWTQSQSVPIDLGMLTRL